MTRQAIGIDLGASYACVAALDPTTHEPNVLAAGERERRLAAVVGYCADGAVLLGSSATRQAITNARHTLTYVKDLAGQRPDAPTVMMLCDRLPFDVQQGPEGTAWLLAREIWRSPAEVLAHLLLRLKELAVEQLGGAVHSAVLTVPAAYDAGQRRALCDAARLAELPVHRLLSDCAAVAIGSGLCRSAQPQTVLIVDAGGGRLQASVMRCGAGSCTTLASLCDPAAGGKDFTQCVVDHLRDDFTRQFSLEVGDDLVAMQRLRDAAEKLKVRLGNQQDGEISLPFLGADATGPKHLAGSLGRQTFEALCTSLLDRSVATVDAALRQADVGVGALDAFLLVGGGATLPGLRDRLEQRLQRAPTQLEDSLTRAACGAALLAGGAPGEPPIDVHEVGDPQLYASDGDAAAQLHPDEFAAARRRLQPPPPSADGG